MGLDMYLEKKSKNAKQLILNNLMNKSDYGELMYWEKNYLIHDWFCENFEIENCKHIEISKEELLELIEYLKDKNNRKDYDKEDYEGIKEDIKKLKEITEKTDWENEEIHYYAWW